MSVQARTVERGVLDWKIVHHPNPDIWHVSTASDWMQVSCSQAYLMCDSEVLILKLWSGDNDGVITASLSLCM